METLIRFFLGKKNRGIKGSGKVAAFDLERMVRCNKGRFFVTSSCAEALDLLKKYGQNKADTIVIALTPGDAKQEKEAREMKFYYTDKLIICHVIDVDGTNFESDDQILINCPISSPCF